MISFFSFLFFNCQILHVKRKPILYSTKNYYSTSIVTSTDYSFSNSNFINIGSMNDHVGAIVAYPISLSSLVKISDSSFIQCKALNRGGAIEVIAADLYISRCSFDRCFLYSGALSQGGISVYHYGNNTNFVFNYSTIKTFDVFSGANEILSHSKQASINFLNYITPYSDGNTFADLTSNKIILTFNNMSNIVYPSKSAGFILHGMKSSSSYDVSLDFCFFKNLESSDQSGSIIIFDNGARFSSTNSSFINCFPYCFYFIGEQNSVVMNNFCFSTKKGEGFTGNYSVELVTGTYKDQVCDRGRLLKFNDVWTYKQTIGIAVASLVIFVVFLYALVTHIILIKKFHRFRNHYGSNNEEEDTSSDF